MIKGQLPVEGPLRLGPISLPAGKLIMGKIPGAPVAWATVDPVPGSGRICVALSELHPETGLVPIQLDGLSGDTRRPWDDGEFGRPEDPRGAHRLDVGALLEDRWNDWVSWPEEDDPDYTERRAPFTLRWPGLAVPEHRLLTPAEWEQALELLPLIRKRHRATPAARIGLVAADRPADVLPVIGWEGLLNRGESVLPLTAVLRSWEDRFGARLMDVGFADIRLLVEHPPRTLAAAQRIAAEHIVLAAECIDGFRDIQQIGARLVNAPIWTFWWD